MQTALKLLLGPALIGAAALGSGCVAPAADPAPDEPIASAQQGLSGESWFSWGGVMNSAGDGYTNGSSFVTDLGVSASGNVCMLTGVNGNLFNTSDQGVQVFTSGGTWHLSARAEPGSSVSAAAVCYPVTGSGYSQFPQGSLSGTLTSGEDPSQEACGFWAVAGVLGSPSGFTVSDNGSDPNVKPLGGSTWTYTEGANINSVGPTCAWTTYSSWWHWKVTGTLTETMPAGTSCFLTSFSGDLDTNSFTNGATATVDFGTGVWTFKVGSGVTAWWLCLD